MNISTSHLKSYIHPDLLTQKVPPPSKLTNQSLNSSCRQSLFVLCTVAEDLKMFCRKTYGMVCVCIYINTRLYNYIISHVILCKTNLYIKIRLSTVYLVLANCTLSLSVLCYHKYCSLQMSPSPKALKENRLFWKYEDIFCLQLIKTE